MQNSQCIVFVYLERRTEAVPAGRLVCVGGKYIFQYGREYIERENVLPVDPLLLPIENGEFVLQEENLGAIRDSAPDYWGRLVFNRLHPGASWGEIDYLLGPNAVRIGNLDFRKSLDEPESPLRVPEFVDLPDMMRIAEAIEADCELNDEDKRAALLLRAGSSLGGARPKCAVKIGDELWLAKFPARDDAHSNARVEGATMTLAGLAGITIPPLFVKSIVGRDVLFIKRFDRTGMYFRLPYMSALSLIGISDQDQRKFSYLDMAAKIRQFGKTEDLKELFRRIAFNIIVRNSDDHPKNHGFLIKDRIFHLSPAFDITPTACAPRREFMPEPELSMAPGFFGKEATLQNLLSGVGEFGLGKEEGRSIFNNTASIVMQNWRDVFSSFKVSEPDARKFAHTFAYFAAR